MTVEIKLVLAHCLHRWPYEYIALHALGYSLDARTVLSLPTYDT